MSAGLVTVERKLACVSRELERRRTVYPRLVDSGKIQQATADDEINAMSAIVADYQASVRFKDSRQPGTILFDRSKPGELPFGVFVNGHLLYFAAEDLRSLADEIADRLTRYEAETASKKRHML